MAETVAFTIFTFSSLPQRHHPPSLPGTNFQVLRVQLGGKEYRVINTKFEQDVILPELMLGFSEIVYDTEDKLRIAKHSSPVSEEFAHGYKSDEEWHGYINHNDRVQSSIAAIIEGSLLHFGLVSVRYAIIQMRTKKILGACLSVSKGHLGRH
ncbi:hypothetical protein LIER_18829 [Lithospermum erythrorhizon]|uniref:Uncharacterized protein n=1 Tax=Lithospermum erythrorhizon TaxID=34254 RepID=A0AAV3QFF4_LITER